MKTHSQSIRTQEFVGRVAELDDASLRTGHATLDADRLAPFGRWIDERLDRLEDRFRHLCTARTLRKSIGR